MTFWHRHSCLNSLIDIVDESLGGIDRGERMEVCYLDFWKTLIPRTKEHEGFRVVVKVNKQIDLP